MAFGSGSRNNRVEGRELVDLAGGGVKIRHAGFGTWDQIKRISDDPEMHVSHHVIRNCLIARRTPTPRGSGSLDRTVFVQHGRAQ